MTQDNSQYGVGTEFDTYARKVGDDWGRMSYRVASIGSDSCTVQLTQTKHGDFSRPDGGHSKLSRTSRAHCWPCIADFTLGCRISFSPPSCYARRRTRPSRRSQRQRAIETKMSRSITNVDQLRSPAHGDRPGCAYFRCNRLVRANENLQTPWPIRSPFHDTRYDNQSRITSPIKAASLARRWSRHPRFHDHGEQQRRTSSMAFYESRPVERANANRPGLPNLRLYRWRLDCFRV